MIIVLSAERESKYVNRTPTIDLQKEAQRHYSLFQNLHFWDSVEAN